MTQRKPRPRISKFAKLTKKFNPAVVGDKAVSEAHGKGLNVLTSYRLNDFKKKAGATHVDMSGNIRRVAFTLAEVLITLGIIGIVAAMTIPTLMTSYKKKIVESRLSKFYSIMNQAVKLSEIENGAVSTWKPISLMWEHDGEDQVVPDENVTGVKSNSYEWFNKYFAPYIKTIKVEKDDHDRDGTTRVYLSDGSLLLVGRMSWTFYPDAKDFKSVEYNDNNITDRDRSGAGTAFFSFRFTPGETDSLHTYDEQWDGTIDALKDHANYGCYNDDTTYERAYCAKLIQLNNWKIPDDYPWF